MKLQGIIIFISSLLVSSCAFVDGLHQPQDDQSPVVSNGQSKTIPATELTTAPLPGSNSGTTEAAKTIAPLTHY